MIARATLEVLAEAAEIGLPEAAVVPASAFDPILRRAIVKRVRAAVEEAQGKLHERSPGDHVLRVAFLMAHGMPADLDASNQSEVAKAFETLAAPYLPKRPDAPATAPGGAYRAAAADRDPLSAVLSPAKRRKRFWPITTPAMIAVLLAVLGGAAVFFAPLYIPTPIARFRSTPLGKALGEPLTDFVADNEAEPNMLSADLKRDVGDATYADLKRVSELARQARGATGTTDAAMAPLFSAVNDLNRDFVTSNKPALLHAYGQGVAPNRAIWLTSYFVTRRDEVTFGGDAVKVAWAHRIDGLNLSDSLLYKADAEQWAILSMDRIEQELVQSLLAPIVLGTPMGPTEYESTDHSPMAELARAAAPRIVKEILDASKIDKGDAEALHRAILQRNELVVSLSKVGYGVKPSSALDLSPGTLRGLNRAKADNPKDAALLDDYVKLGQRTASYRKAITPATSLLARIEEERFVARLAEVKRLADVPPEKVSALGIAAQSKRGRAIASADLSLLARETQVPHLVMWRLGQRILGDDEDEGTIAILSAVLKELALLDANDPTLAVDRVLVRALQKAFELPPEQVRAAAGKAYASIFGGPPPPLERK